MLIGNQLSTFRMIFASLSSGQSQKSKLYWRYDFIVQTKMDLGDSRSEAIGLEMP